MPATTRDVEQVQTVRRPGVVGLRRNPAQAVRRPRRARDRDPTQLRAPTATQELVRTTASQLGVPLIDTASTLPRHQRPTAPMPSRYLFRDNLHFSADGHAAMTKLLAPTLQQLLEDAA